MPRGAEGPAGASTSGAGVVVDRLALVARPLPVTREAVSSVLQKPLRSQHRHCEGISLRG